MPGGVAKTFIQTKEPELKGAFDERLARVVCYAFSVPPQAFVSQINRATGETIRACRATHAAADDRNEPDSLRWPNVKEAAPCPSPTSSGST
ncbi:MAG TPA: hypothetical protein VK446_05525 [Methylocystis sp.]|nr:hypothetical protein [Methylocystis sp.]